MSEQRPNTSESIPNLIAQSWAAIKAAIGILAMVETPSPPKRWRHALAALLIVAIASVIRAEFFADLGRGTPYVTYFPAVALAALYGGFLSGFLATVVSAWLCFYWIQQGHMSDVESMALATFVVSNTIVAGVAEAMHRARKGKAQADESVREGEDQFRGLVEQSIAGIYVVQDEKFAYVNQRFAEICGYQSANELIGRDSISLVFESDRDRVRDIMRRRSESGDRSVSYKFSAKCKDGSTVQVGINSASATYKGRAAFIGMMQDITEKTRNDEEIARYVEQLKTAFMSTVDVVTALGKMRDPYTAGHEHRAAMLAVVIGGELGMASHRPYRAGLGIDKALAEIKRGRGTAFDPEVVDACLTVFRQDGFAFHTA